MATTESMGMTFPKLLDEEVEYLATRPIPLHERTPGERMDEAFATVERDHPRIQRAIKGTWGHKECSAYMKKLILNGGYHDGKNHIGFRPDMVAALLVLDDVHDEKFGSF